MVIQFLKIKAEEVKQIYDPQSILIACNWFEGLKKTEQSIRLEETFSETILIIYW